MVQCCFLVQRSKARSLASRWAGSKKVNLPEGVSQGGSVVYKYFQVIFIEIQENEGQLGLRHVSVEEVYKGYVKMMEVQFQKAAWT